MPAWSSAGNHNIRRTGGAKSESPSSSRRFIRIFITIPCKFHEGYHGADLYIFAQPAGQQPLAGAHLSLAHADHAQHGGDTRDNAAARRRGQRPPFASKVFPGNHRLRAPATQVQRSGILQDNVSKLNICNAPVYVFIIPKRKSPRNSATLTPSVRASRRLLVLIRRLIPRTPCKSFASYSPASCRHASRPRPAPIIVCVNPGYCATRLRRPR